jgi:hypothetical protein
MKLTKKLLSVVLAITLVVTTIPMSAISALAVVSRDTSDVAVTQLETAMTDYENKMMSGVYTNMGDAYDAYVAANKAYDAYVYGNADSSSIKTATTNLTNATNAMSEWSAYSGTDHATFANDNDYVSDENYASVYKNVLYGTKSISALACSYESFQSGKSNYLTNPGFYFGETTLLYDGTTTPQIGVVFECERNDKPLTWNWNNLRLFAAYVASGDVAFTEGWHARDTQLNCQWMLLGNSANSSIGYAGDQSSTYYTIGTGATYFSNYLQYTGTLTSSDDVLVSVTPTFGFRIGYDSANAQGTTTSSITFKVINYKKVTDTIQSYRSLLSSVSSYKQGGLSNVIAGYDLATIDPNSFFTSSNNYDGCASNYTTAITNITSTPTADSTTGYTALKKAILDKIATYNSTASDKYTTESWNAFVSAYEAATAHMTAIPTTGYNDTEAKALADALNAVELEVNFTPADTAELEDIIDDAVVAINNSSYFTTDSFKAGNFSYNVLNAKYAVWGSEESYKDEASKISSDQQDVVETWSTTIGEAIMGLEINTDAPVASAKGYSMDGAIEYAATFNSSDYSNYSAVVEAVATAQLFNTKITTSESGAVEAKIEKYIDYTKAIIVAIMALHPAFSKIQNGTVVNSGTSTTTTITSKEDSGSWKLSWTRNSGQIFFRTDHAITTFDLGGSEFGFYGKTSYDNMLDGVNLLDVSYDSTGYITNSRSTSDWPLSQDQINSYTGGLATTNSGGTFRLSNIVVTSIGGSNTAYGKYTTDDQVDSVTDITDSSFVYDSYLETVQGTYPPTGGIVAKSGTTNFTSDFTLTMSKESKKTLSAKTVPTLTSFDLSNYLGMTYYYKVASGAFTWGGYAHDVEQYSQKADVINVAYLFDLIDDVDSLNYLEYTKSTWDDLQTALTAAKDSMNYEVMTAEEIYNECLTRYNNLWNAKAALDKPLSNEAIEEAVNNAMDIYNATNSSGIYSATSWAAFEEAYTAAYNTVHNNGIYTTINIRDVDNTEENAAAIAKVAQDLVDAFNALQKVADFSVLTDAVTQLMSGIADNTYSVSSLKSLASTLSSLKYLNYTDEQKGVTYDDEQDSLDAEAEEIKALTLDVATVDSSSLDATVEKVKKDYTDPDAWDETSLANVIQAVEDIDIYENVDVYGYNVIGIKYDTQADLDSEVSSILSGIVPQDYTVYVDGVAQGTYEYGEQAEITFPTTCAIYYAYTSNTATNTAKYYTTDHIIKFIVKGNTYLTTKSASDAETSKVTFVNGIKNKTYEVDYVTTGSSIQLPTAPSVAFYEFAGYTVNGKDYAEGDSVDISKATTIVANYEISDEATSTVTVLMSSGTDAFSTVKQATISTNYNTLVELSESSLITAKSTTKGTYVLDGETKSFSTNKFNRYTNKDVPIYSYAVVSSDDSDDNNSDAIISLIVSGDIVDEDNRDEFGNVTYTSRGYDGIATIVAYGSDYSFYATNNTVVIPLSEEETNLLISTGIANVDAQGASAGLKQELVDATTKYSMVGTYGLPQGATLVEAGILFSKDQTAELTFANAGNGTVYRMKSSQHTVGNQFVVSVVKPSSSYDVKYMSYVIYKLNGTEYTVYSNEITNTFDA